MKKIQIIAALFLGLSFTSNSDAYTCRFGSCAVFAPIGGVYLSYPSFGYYPAFLTGYGRYGTYGSIAYSVGTGLTGWSSGWNNQADAENEALWRCGAADCQTAVWFRGACATLAVSRWNESIFGWAYAGNAAVSQNLALRQCRIRGGVDCYTTAWACSP